MLPAYKKYMNTDFKGAFLDQKYLNIIKNQRCKVQKEGKGRERFFVWENRFGLIRKWKKDMWFFRFWRLYNFKKNIKDLFKNLREKDYKKYKLEIISINR